MYHLHAETPRHFRHFFIPVQPWLGIPKPHLRLYHNCVFWATQPINRWKSELRSYHTILLNRAVSNYTPFQEQMQSTTKAVGPSRQVIHTTAVLHVPRQSACINTSVSFS